MPGFAYTVHQLTNARLGPSSGPFLIVSVLSVTPSSVAGIDSKMLLMHNIKDSDHLTHPDWVEAMAAQINSKKGKIL